MRAVKCFIILTLGVDEMNESYFVHFYSIEKMNGESDTS
jgi:hypothetical protein